MSGVRRQTTCWLRADQEQQFFEALESYAEAAQQLEWLTEPPSYEREQHGRHVRVTYVLRWADAEAPSRSHPDVDRLLEQLVQSCRRLRPVGPQPVCA